MFRLFLFFSIKVFLISNIVCGQNPFLRPGSNQPKPVVQKPVPPPPPPKPQNTNIELEVFLNIKTNGIFQFLIKPKIKEYGFRKERVLMMEK